MSSQEAMYAPPRCEKYQHWAKGLWALGGSIKQRGGQTQSWRKADAAMERGYGQTAAVGAYANQRLKPAKRGRPMEDRPGLQTGPGKSGRPAL